MNKVHRQSVDIRIAFIAQSKNLSTNDPIQNAFDPGLILSNSRSHPLKFIIGVLYRHIFKPLARPFASRFRQYLVASIRQEISQSMFAQISEQTNASMLCELKLIQQNLLLEMTALRESFKYIPYPQQEPSSEVNAVVTELSRELQKHISECDIRLTAIEQR